MTYTEQIITQVDIMAVGTKIGQLHLTSERVVAILDPVKKDNPGVYAAAAAGGVIGAAIFNIIFSAKKSKPEPAIPQNLTLDEKIKTNKNNWFIHNKDVVSIAYATGRMSNNLIIEAPGNPLTGDKPLKIEVKDTHMHKNMDSFKQIFGDKFSYKPWNKK